MLRQFKSNGRTGHAGTDDDGVKVVQLRLPNYFREDSKYFSISKLYLHNE